MNKIRELQVMFVLSMLITIISAQGLGGLSSGLSLMCHAVRSLLPIVAFLMVVCAGVVYAAGQFLGAETRARASVWATAMLVGAIIGFVIVLITPILLGAMWSEGTFSC